MIKILLLGMSPEEEKKFVDAGYQILVTAYDQDPYIRHKHFLKQLQLCDAVVVNSAGEVIMDRIFWALEVKKPVLDITETKPPLKHSSLKTLNCTLNDRGMLVIAHALKEIESQLDSKFILVISPEINRYLEWASTEKRMHKAQIVRGAVEELSYKDKRYQQFLKEGGFKNAAII